MGANFCWSMVTNYSFQWNLPFSLMVLLLPFGVSHSVFTNEIPPRGTNDVSREYSSVIYKDDPSKVEVTCKGPSRSFTVVVEYHDPDIRNIRNILQFQQENGEDVFEKICKLSEKYNEGTILTIPIQADGHAFTSSVHPHIPGRSSSQHRSPLKGHLRNFLLSNLHASNKETIRTKRPCMISLQF